MQFFHAGRLKVNCSPIYIIREHNMLKLLEAEKYSMTEKIKMGFNQHFGLSYLPLL